MKSREILSLSQAPAIGAAAWSRVWIPEAAGSGFESQLCH